MKKPTEKTPAVKKAAKPSAKTKQTATPTVKKAAVKKAAAKKPPKLKATRKSVTDTAPTLRRLPEVWTLSTKVQTVGLWVDERFVWTGNNRGEIFCFNRETGATVRTAKLPGECVALVSDDAWKYAGCDDGNVYDLTGKIPRVAYQLGGTRIDWIEIYQGVLACSDDTGTVTVIDVDGSTRWKKEDAKATEGWVLRTTGDALYHGSRAGLRKYSWDGKLRWKKNPGDVRYGIVTGEQIFVTAGFYSNSRRTVSKLIDCKSGNTLWDRAPDRKLSKFHSNGAEACGAASGEGGQRYYSSIGGWLFCYDAAGTLLWQSPTNCDSLCNLHVLDDQLYFSSANGTIGRADVSPAAIAKALANKWTQARGRSVERVKSTAKSTDVESTSSVGSGVVVECVKDGSKIRVRVITEGYNREWFCQFPNDIRVAGARFVVDQVLEAKQGGFYRVLGDIRRLKK